MGILIQMMKTFRVFLKYCCMMVLLCSVTEEAAAGTTKSKGKSIAKKRSIKPKSSAKKKAQVKKSNNKKKPGAAKKSNSANASKKASAQQKNNNGINHLASHNFWSVHSYKEGGKKVCFVASKPQKSKGDYTNRDEVFFMISHRQDPNDSQGKTLVKNELSFVAGYPLKDGANVTVSIDGVDHKMPIVKGSNAWAKDETEDEKIVAAMKAGNSMVVKGVSKKGTATTDNFSLKGVTAALARAKKECGF